MQFKIFSSLRPFKSSEMIRNGFAGLALASMNIPQVLGYARIAGMPIVTGLYTVILPIIGFAVFGSSRHLVVAADSATAAIFSSSLSQMAIPASEHYVALVGMVALLTAVLLFLARIFKLGFLADFLSRTVLVGFMTGVGLQVGIAMLGDIFGISITSHHSFEQIQELFQHVSSLNVPTFWLSVAIITVILSGRRFFRRVPFPFILVIVSIAASAWFHFSEIGIVSIGLIPSGLPSIHIPSVNLHEIFLLVPVAVSCFVMIIAQSAATSRIFAVRHHERVDENADILGLALANAAAGFSGAFVVNGSPTQTKMADSVGSTNQMTQLTFAAVVLIVLLFFTGALQYLPRCVLASVVFTIAVGMVDIKGLRAMRKESPGEFTLALLTAIGVLLLGVEQGILIAFSLSLLRHVNHSYRPHTMMLIKDQAGHWEPTLTTPGKDTEPGLIIYRFCADLFYANDLRFADEVLTLIRHAPNPVKWFVVDAAAVTDIDFSAARSMDDLIEELNKIGVALIFARVNSFLQADMNRHQLTDRIGVSRIFPTLHAALASIGIVAQAKNAIEN